MTCEACPITVKKALQKFRESQKIDVLIRKETGRVTFDDSKTNTEELVKATTNAGYPSQPETGQEVAVSARSFRFGRTR